MHYIKDLTKRHSKLSPSYRKFAFYLYEEFYRRVEILLKNKYWNIEKYKFCANQQNPNTTGSRVYISSLHAKNVLGKFIAENISEPGSRLFYESSGILASAYIVIVTNVLHLINRFVFRGSQLINVQRNDCNILLKSWEYISRR